MMYQKSLTKLICFSFDKSTAEKSSGLIRSYLDVTSLDRVYGLIRSQTLLASCICSCLIGSVAI